MLRIQFKLDSKFIQKNERERGFVEFCTTVIRILNIFGGFSIDKRIVGENEKKWWKIKYCRPKKDGVHWKNIWSDSRERLETRGLDWILRNDFFTTQKHILYCFLPSSQSSFDFQHLFLADIFSAWNLSSSNFSLFVVVSFAALFTRLNCLSVTQ